jgi:EAL domain-containing protein (putative c-di-GMP-specific phosphodiesterase class I)
VSGIIDLASSLGLRVIAEGIRTANQLEELKNVGCELGQGYYCARSLPANAIPLLLKYDFRRHLV